MSSSISSILGIGYTVETVWNVAYNPEPWRGWNIEVSDACRTERFFSLSSNKTEVKGFQKLVTLEVGEFSYHTVICWLNDRCNFLVAVLKSVCKERCVFSAVGSCREGVRVSLNLPRTCLRAQTRPWASVHSDTGCRGSVTFLRTWGWPRQTNITGPFLLASVGPQDSWHHSEPME